MSKGESGMFSFGSEVEGMTRYQAEPEYANPERSENQKRSECGGKNIFLCSSFHSISMYWVLLFSSLSQGVKTKTPLLQPGGDA